MNTEQNKEFLLVWLTLAAMFFWLLYVHLKLDNLIRILETTP